MLYLQRLSPSDGGDIYGLLQEIASNDNGFHNPVFGMTFDQFKLWLEKEYAVDNGALEDWMVPQSSYWLYDDTVPVGYGRLRHYLNKQLLETGGHIGYAVARSKRGMGYGNRILALLLDECRRMGILSVQVGANADNVRSNKVIAKNGGQWTGERNGKNFYSIALL